jgi:hypothetical protein
VFSDVVDGVAAHFRLTSSGASEVQKHEEGCVDRCTATGGLCRCVLVSLCAVDAGLGTTLCPLSVALVVPAEDVGSVPSSGTAVRRVPPSVGARAAITKIELVLVGASTAILGAGAIPFSGEIRQLAREIVDVFQDLCVVRYPANVRERSRASVMRPVQRATTSSPTSGIPARVFGWWRVNGWSRECAVSSPECPVRGS